MKSVLSACAVVLIAASFANSTESMEAARVGAESAFVRLAPVKLRPKAMRSVHLTGYLSLDGNAYVSNPNPGGSVMVTFNGSTMLRDSSGATANAYFTVTQTFFINGNFTSGYVYPQQYVQVYHNGRSVGSVMVSGSIYVSGFVNGSWIRLSGSGNVSGSGTVQE